MEKRPSILGIFIYDLQQSEQVNRLLHEYADVIIGRMGIPCKSRGLSVIVIVLDADGDTLNALSGKLGRISGVQTKSMMAKM